MHAQVALALAFPVRVAHTAMRWADTLDNTLLIEFVWVRGPALALGLELVKIEGSTGGAPVLAVTCLSYSRFTRSVRCMW